MFVDSDALEGKGMPKYFDDVHIFFGSVLAFLFFLFGQSDVIKR